MIENITKQNGNIAFVEETHKYFDVTNPNAVFTSVTTLIHNYTQPFDKEFWSAYKAVEKLLPKDAWVIEKKSLLNSKKFDKQLLEAYDISESDFNKEQQAILDAWDEENRKSCERGTKIHADFEHSFYAKKKDIDISKFEIGGKFICEKDRTALDLENGIYPEYLIHRISEDGKLRIAGQIDLLVKKGNKIIIGDFKGLPLNTKIPTLNGWSTIEHLQVGDFIFDKDGNPTKIVNKSSIHYNPCYKITFDNGKTIIADHEHKWLISFRKSKSKKRPDGYEHRVMTTEEIFTYIQQIPEGKGRRSDLIPKIVNPKPLNIPDKSLPIDPYVLGCWLGDGSKQCGAITNITTNLWDEIQRRGYTIGKAISAKDKAECHTILGLRPKLKALNLINNKHIPEIYQRASFNQRLDLLRGLMDTDGFFHPKRKRFVMSTGQEWQRDDLVKLLATFGIKATVFEVTRKCNEKSFIAWDVCFSTNLFNPFLSRNQEIKQVGNQDNRSFRNIEKVELVDTIPTQCLEVDSPSHTFLCTEEMIVTHNTNRKIETKSFFNQKTKQSVKMKYPLNNLDDTNYWHYTLQLSTYAWMIQKYNPDFEIEDLVMIHIDHSDNMTIYHLPYLKDEVIKMLNHFKKESILKENREKRKPIEY